MTNEVGINVLSLFDGMSCGQIALERAGIKVNKYFASEIDKYAIKVTQANYPNTIQVGDITKIKYTGRHKIDLLLGGSPCQGFSFSGHQLNFEDPRSKLFFEYIRLLKQCNPRYFILENVRMEKRCSEEITEILGVPYKEINSSLFSAQMRRRLYWTNLPIDDIKDFNISFASIMEANADDRYYTPKLQKIENVILRDKAYCLCASTSYSKHSFLRKQCNLVKTPKGIRRLTPLEAERLQTVPDNYTNIVTDTQRYKMLGNGWTIDVVAHILKGIK